MFVFQRARFGPLSQIQSSTFIFQRARFGPLTRIRSSTYNRAAVAFLVALTLV